MTSVSLENLNEWDGSQNGLENQVVHYHCERLNVFKSAVPDDMHHRALKDLADIIAEALANYHAVDVKRAGQC